MNITVFTSNQARHISLIERLAEIADTVYAVQECSTVFPGEVAGFYQKSDTMQKYFSNMLAAQDKVFGPPRFLPSNVQSMPLLLGDLNKLSLSALSPALQSDYYVVFGSSFIKGELIDFLVSKQALNIHMGLSPYYRGNSCNFWALKNNQPDYVGATIHRLTKGLDSGPMLFHAIPEAKPYEAFELGMVAVKAAHKGLVESIRTGSIQEMETVAQNKELEILYTRNSDFTDEVAAAYLTNAPSPDQIYECLANRDTSHLLNPYIL